MYIHITTGTYEFLSSTKNKYSDETLILMQNHEHALLLHETNGSTIFKSARSYEVINSIGPLKEVGFVALTYLSITEEGRPLLEDYFKHQINKIANENGLVAIRILRPQKSDTYIIFTLWDKEISFRNWLKSSNFKDTFENNKNIGISPQPKLFETNQYTSTYLIQSDKNK